MSRKSKPELLGTVTLGSGKKSQRITPRRRALRTWETGKKDRGSPGRKEPRYGGVGSRETGEGERRLKKDCWFAIRNLWHLSRGQVQWSCGGAIHNVYPMLELMTLLIVFYFPVFSLSISSLIASGFWVKARMGIGAILMGLIWLGLLKHVIILTCLTVGMWIFPITRKLFCFK